MLNFWAGWCGPCRAEIPYLKRVMEKYKDLSIVSISIDEKDDNWQKALKEEQVSWAQLRNSKGIYGGTLDVCNITGVPTCIIIDKKGRFYKMNMRGTYLDEFFAETFGKQQKEFDFADNKRPEPCVKQIMHGSYLITEYAQESLL